MRLFIPHLAVYAALFIPVANCKVLQMEQEGDDGTPLPRSKTTKGI